jgi:hypothetical protein
MINVCGLIFQPVSFFGEPDAGKRNKKPLSKIFNLSNLTLSLVSESQQKM